MMSIPSTNVFVKAQSVKSPAQNSQPRAFNVAAFCALLDVARTAKPGNCAKCAAVRPPKNPDAPVTKIFCILPKLNQSNGL
jgi:hypothetical protein